MIDRIGDLIINFNVNLLESSLFLVVFQISIRNKMYRKCKIIYFQRSTDIVHCTNYRIIIFSFRKIYAICKSPLTL